MESDIVGIRAIISDGAEEVVLSLILGPVGLVIVITLVWTHKTRSSVFIIYLSHD